MIGRIYKLINLNNDDIYIGSTTKTLEKRLINHKSDCKSYYENNNRKISYNTSFKIIKDGNYKIELIEFECNNRNELLMKERYYIKNIKCINKCSPIRTEEERVIENSYENRKEYFRNYTKINKEKKKEYDKIYNQTIRKNKKL